MTAPAEGNAISAEPPGKAPCEPPVDAGAPEGLDAAPVTGSASARAPASWAAAWLLPETRSRRILLGLGLYVVCLVTFAIFAGDRLVEHTSYNHYALLADAWLHGRHHLLGPPPSYAGMNDFALYGGQWFVSFPPFPAILMMPLVWVAGSPENFRDGQFIVWLAGIGPAALFLVFEKLRRTGRSLRTERQNALLALSFAFGTVFFFTAVQGTVWFAAHVVGVALTALFVLFALDAERPALAGAMLGCMFLTRTTTLLVGVFFVLEAARVAAIRPAVDATEDPSESAPLLDRAARLARRVDPAALARRLVPFAAPVLAAFAFASWINYARFHDPAPWAFGHEHLQIGWKTRIDRWGLFSFHFLPRNLSVVLASLPWAPPPGAAKVPLELLGMTFAVPRYVISGHGLALWVTTPLYLWLLRPKRVGLTWAAAALAALGPAVMDLLYQNSGWFQFGYRFSNDYAVLLFVLLVVGSGPRLSRLFWAAAAWSIVVNAFGAASFERPKYNAFYSHQAAIGDVRYGGPATMDLVYPPD